MHLLMKRRISWNNTKPFFVRNEWVANLGTWYGLSIRVKRLIKPWTGVREIVDSHRFPERIRYHMWVEKNAPWMGPHLNSKLVMICGIGLE